jgi:hypothetical protein
MHPGRRFSVSSTGIVIGAVLAMVVAATPAHGQQGGSLAAPAGVAAPQRPQSRDSLQPPLSPGRAFLNSLLLPGLGQSRLRRQVPAAFYYTIEVVSIAMLHKTRTDLRIAKELARTRVVDRFQVDPITGEPVLVDGAFVPVDTVANRFDEERVSSRQQQFEDWAALLVFNHLFSGADAFVASLLWDVPARVGFRPVGGRIGLGLTVPW